MKEILFVTTRLPYPPREGHQIRTYNLLKHATSQYKVHLISFVRQDDDKSSIGVLNKMCASVTLHDIPLDQSKLKLVIALFFSLLDKKAFVVRKYAKKAFANSIKKVIECNNIRLVHLDMLPLGQYIDICGEGRPVFLNNHNVESLLLQRRSEHARLFFERLFFRSQAGKLKHFECTVCEQVDHLFVCSIVDANIIKKFISHDRVTVIPNGVDTRYFNVAPGKPVDVDSLVFVGGMGYFPNKQGMEFFLEKIYAKIVAHFPNIKLQLVGQHDALRLPESKLENVELMGFVDDFRSIVLRAAIYVLPLRAGSGTRLKLLEALSMGKAIVSTSIACEGVSVSHNKDIVIADTADDFAKAVIALLSDTNKLRELGINARRLAENEYDWQSIGKQMLAKYRTYINTAT